MAPYYGRPQLSRQNQKPHGENKIPHGKTKHLTAKSSTSQQKQKSFGFALGICFCREVFGFCCEVFGFAVTVVGHRTVQFTFSGGKISVRVYPCWICCPLRHFIRYVCSKSRKSNNHFSQPLLSAFSCGLRYFSAQSRFSYLVYRLPRFQSK